MNPIVHATNRDRDHVTVCAAVRSAPPASGVAAAVAAVATALLTSPAALASNPEGCASGRMTGGSRLLATALTDDGRLLCFNVRNPGKAREIGQVQGLLAADTALIGVDYRIQDGLLYGVGNGGGVYRIDTDNATATFVNSLSVPLSGAAFGVDFNPAADRLRIISDDGQNLRHNVNPGGVTIADAALNYTAGVAAAGIGGAAYTNNDADPNTGTTLFDLDTTLDQVVLQSPPNTGALASTGKLGADLDAAAGFDIYTRSVDGITAGNLGFAALTDGSGTSQLYRVDLLNGRATPVGAFAETVVDIALPVKQ